VIGHRNAMIGETAKKQRMQTNSSLPIVPLWFTVLQFEGFYCTSFLFFSPDCVKILFCKSEAKKTKKIATKAGLTITITTTIALQNLRQLCKLIIISTLIFPKHLGKLMQFYILGIEKQFSKRKSKI
jgi:hypothetical protein